MKKYKILQTVCYAISLIPTAYFFYFLAILITQHVRFKTELIITGILTGIMMIVSVIVDKKVRDAEKAEKKEMENLVETSKKILEAKKALAEKNAENAKVEEKPQSEVKEEPAKTEETQTGNTEDTNKNTNSENNDNK